MMNKIIQMHFQITGGFITERVRELAMDHRLSLANEVFQCLKPIPKREYQEAVLLGHAEFIGMTLCNRKNCDQCKGKTAFQMIFKENIEYQQELKKHEKFIKEHYIVIDGDLVASKNKISEVTEKEKKLKELKQLRKNERDDEDIFDDYSIKSKIVDAEDDYDATLETLYQEFGVSMYVEYEIGSRQWKDKLQVDGLLELIKARSVNDKSVRELIGLAKRSGRKHARDVINSKKELLAYRESVREIKKKVKPSKEKVKVGKFSIPKNILDDYVESVRSMRAQMTIGMSRQDPIIGANALALRIKQHKRIFEALKIVYHQDDKATKESHKLYDVVEKYIEKKYPELSLDNVGKNIKKRFGK